MDAAEVMTALDEADALDERLATAGLQTLSVAELQTLADRLEARRRRQPALEHRILAELRTRTTPAELGAKNWTEVLARRLRISNGEATRRLQEAEQLGPRTALSGEVLAPQLAMLAAAQAAGTVNAEHVRIIREFFDKKLPHWVDPETRELAEAHLVDIAAGDQPDGLRKAAERLAMLIDQDGPMPDDTDRARRRYFTVGPQGRDGMSEVRGLLDPEACATLDAVLAKSAAPGHCNPDDQVPCVDGDPTAEQVQRDTRSQPQRNHDALKALCRAMLASGQLGQHNGLPVTVIVSTTLQDLESAAGVAVTGGTSLLPMSDVIRMAAHAHHYLAIFDKHTNAPLYLGRTKRLASAAQRIMLLARDRGCTFPGCTVPGYGCQVDHLHPWSAGGPTDITNEDLACGPHNRLRDRGWTTRRRKDGRIEWIPPPALDTGQTRVNDYHHPENLLMPDDDEQ